MICWSFW